ncbi:MAG TPA: TonB family protein [Bacteroidetes bacterium]|nr:TonB family protein [Bacteroidota bacterium]
MLSYLLKASLCWALFYLLYHAWLGKETFFKVNRWYLMGTALLGLAIPAVDFQWLLPAHEEPVLFTYLQPITIGVDQLEAAVVTTSAGASGFDWWALLVAVYWTGAALAALRFGLGLFKINKLFNKGEKRRLPKYIFINTPSRHVPFSFFKNLFWSKNFEASDEDRENILRHEEAHIFQWHSVDVVLFELLGVLFWCSPFIYLYKKAVKTTHEYLADDYVLAQADRKDYGRLLLRQSQAHMPIPISNSLFSSQLKQRIVMMTKNKSSKAASLKYLAGLPLLALLFLAFSFNEKMPNGQEGMQAGFNEKITTDTFPDDAVFKVVEEAPLFPGCEEVAGETAKKRCSDTKMLDFIYSNIKYPQEARDKGTEGMIVVKFIVEKDGSISNAEVIRSIGDGCDEEVLRVVGMMPNWTPGRQRGKEVRVQFNLPVKFKLDSSSPPLPNPNFNDGEEFFKVVEDMPLFPGCDNLTDKKERTKCSQERMLDFIYSNIKYPQAARDKGIQGMAIVQFIIEKDGSLSGAKMLRSIGGGCDEEVMRLVGMMPKWTPGKQRGREVRVQFNLPVKFKLEGESKIISTDGKMNKIPLNEGPGEIETGKDLIVADNVVDIFEAYPNPSSQNGFTLKFKTQAGPVQIKVVDMAGRELANLPFKDYDGTEQEARFDGLFQKNAQRGTVFVTLMDGKGNTLKGIKVVVQ